MTEEADSEILKFPEIPCILGKICYNNCVTYEAKQRVDESPLFIVAGDGYNTTE